MEDERLFELCNLFLGRLIRTDTTLGTLSQRRARIATSLEVPRTNQDLKFGYVEREGSYLDTPPGPKSPISGP